jgi:hypothetical protein
MNRAPIEGKVAGILTERELVINVGTNKGVQKAMKFKVLAKPAEITDPDTGELLATIAREKVRVEATDVHEKYSICSTYRVTVVYPGFSISKNLGKSLKLSKRRILNLPRTCLKKRAT